MFSTIGGILFAFIVMLIMYYYSMILMNKFYNSKWMIKLRNDVVDVVEALIDCQVNQSEIQRDLEELWFLCKMEEL